MSGSRLRMTNFYPYYINTGLFEGFQPKLGWILPTLKQEKVIDRMYNAIMAEEKEVFIPSLVWHLRNIMNCLPLAFKHYLANILVGEGMEYFVGRRHQFIKDA